MRFLAVDDDPFILATLDQVLAAGAGHELTTATSGQEALAVIASHPAPFDCFLIDIRMPSMDGIELCARIRLVSEYKFMPILMLTAVVDREHVTRAFSVGATDFITKPFDILELATRIRAAEKIALVQQANRDLLISHQDCSKDQPDYDKTLFDISFPIEDVSRCIDIKVLENFLKQINRRQALETMVVGFKYLESFSAYYQLSIDKFYHKLTDVAKAITTGARSSGLVIAYAGSGYFVGTAKRQNERFLRLLAQRIQGVLTEMERFNSPGDGFDISVSVGKACVQSKFSHSNPKGLILEAISSVSDGQGRLHPFEKVG